MNRQYHLQEYGLLCCITVYLPRNKKCTHLGTYNTLVYGNSSSEGKISSHGENVARLDDSSWPGRSNSSSEISISSPEGIDSSPGGTEAHLDDSHSPGRTFSSSGRTISSPGGIKRSTRGTEARLDNSRSPGRTISSSWRTSSSLEETNSSSGRISSSPVEMDS